MDPRLRGDDIGLAGLFRGVIPLRAAASQNRIAWKAMPPRAIKPSRFFPLLSQIRQSAAQCGLRIISRLGLHRQPARVAPLFERVESRSIVERQRARLGAGGAIREVNVSCVFSVAGQSFTDIL